MHRLACILVLTALALVALPAYFGCSCPKKTAPPADSSTGTPQAVEPQVAEATPRSQEDLRILAEEVDRQSGTDLGSRSLEAALNKREVTEEELRALTAFGPFFFPEATLVTEKSFYQKLPDGTEIYKIELGTSASVDAVSQWYRDNLEPGKTEASGNLGTGSAFYGFSYASPDGVWMKRITIKGFESQSGSTISVNLSRKGEVEPESPVSTGG